MGISITAVAPGDGVLATSTMTGALRGVIAMPKGDACAKMKPAMKKKTDNATLEKANVHEKFAGAANWRRCDFAKIACARATVRTGGITELSARINWLIKRNRDTVELHCAQPDT